MAKRVLSVALVLILALCIIPLPVSAAENPQSAAQTAPLEKGTAAATSADADSTGVACLDRDAAHGDSIWAAIAALEDERLPDGAGPEDYAALYDEVEDIVTSSGEYVEGSLVYSGDTLYWDTPDGMGHGWSPYLRAEMNGSSDTDESEDVVPVGEDSLPLTREVGSPTANPEGEITQLDSCRNSFDSCPPVREATDEEASISTASEADSSPDGETGESRLAPTKSGDEPLQFVPTGADSDLSEIADGVTSTAKDIALFAPYHGYSGDIWSDETDLLNKLSTTTGGTSTTYNNADATIDAIADAMESCAVVIVYTHGTVDRNGAMYDSRMSNSSYICLTTGTGITSDDTAWVTGKYGRYRHVYNIGASEQSDNHTVYMVDGTAIVNHMEKEAPNNLLWMHSCFTMATDGLCKPLMDRGVGVMYGWSKPGSALGGATYMEYFFESLLTGSTVATAARYMKQAAGCEWDPLFKYMDYNTVIDTRVAFPVFAADNTPYPGQYSVDGTQTVSSNWRLPFKDETSYLKRSVLNVNQLQRVDCTFRFAPNFTAVKKLSGSLPTGMQLYWNSTEFYVRGTPTATGAYSATYQLTSGGSTYTLRLDIAVVGNQNTDYTYDLAFTSGDSYSNYINPSSDYFSCRRISGSLPLNMSDTMTASGMNIKTLSWVDSQGDTYTCSVVAGKYTMVYEIVNKHGSRYMCTVNLTVRSSSASHLSDKTITMVKGFKSIVKISETRYFRIEVESGSLPEGTRAAYSYGEDFCIIGTPKETGTYTAKLKLYKYNGGTTTVNIKVNVNEPSASTCTVRLFSLYGGNFSSSFQKGNTSYTLPEYTETVPSGVRFTGWWCNNKVYKPGDKITVNAVTVDIYALCENIEPIKYVGVSGVVAPKDGATPSYTASAPSGAFYMVEDYNDAYGWKNGVCWFYDGSRMSGTDRFESGRKYTVRVSLVPKSEQYEFATSDLHGTVNTNTAKAAAFNSSTATKNIYVEYTFTCPGPIKISSVTVSGITEPVAGGVPDELCTLPANCGYKAAQVNYGEITWYTEDGDILNPDTDRFKAGEKYSAQLTLMTLDGYEFVESGLTGTINGKDATKSIFIAKPKKRIYISRWFTCSSASSYWIGDVNADGAVKNRDALILDRYIAGWKNYDQEIKNWDAADLTRDGLVKNKDALTLDRYIAGWMSYQKYVYKVQPPK